MYWLLLKLVFLTFVPLPINPKVTRPDPQKLFWTFTCDEFKSPYQLAKLFYTDTRKIE
jgi:hypothetical protein